MEPEKTCRQAYTSEWESDEPIEAPIPEMMFSFTFSDHNLTWVEAFQDETTCKAELYFQYDATHYIQLDLPYMKVIDVSPPIEAGGRIPQVVKCQIMEAAANPTGMSSAIPRFLVLDENSSAYE